ncbi:MAG: ATP-binding protein [Bdellovibrio bacteriovorus]
MSSGVFGKGQGARAAFRLPVRRWFWLPIGISGMLVAAVLLALVGVAWLGQMRIEPVRGHLVAIGGLRDLAMDIEQVLFQAMRDGQDTVSTTELAGAQRALGPLVAEGDYLNAGTPERLRGVAALLSNTGSTRAETLFDALGELRAVLAAERSSLEGLMDRIARDTRAELDLAVVLLGVLPLFAVGGLLALRRRVQRPLESLGDLLARLAQRDYRPVPEELLGDSAPLVQPVFRNYNELVHRLQELEADHDDRERNLELQVRQATGALLTQSRQLARSERLAAVGAVSAGLAHELRNPLAGIQMACMKLQRALGDSDQSARLEAVVTELKRLNRLLSDRVDAARHAPEPLSRLDLKGTVEAFLSLVRYQVPEGVRLICEVPDGLVCQLPEGGLRQALLNLTLNAAQSLEGGEGEVAIRAHREEQSLVLSVSDTGPGFPPEMLAVGVRPFASGRVGGTGLGLAMVRRFAEDINGELVLGNREPHGARVTLRFPCLQTVAVGSEGPLNHA